MDCTEAHLLIADRQRGRLPPNRQDELAAHLASCAECRREEAVEVALTEAMERALPQHAASLALKRRLATHLQRRSTSDSVVSPRRRPTLVAYAVATLAVAAAVTTLYLHERSLDALAEARMGDEAVNDHLRVLDGDEPLAIVSSGIHEVKPWFAGKLDFAPILSFAGDDDFPLRGGVVSHFLDRKAATVVYGRRRHTISLFVFRAEGLSWSARGLTSMGRVHARLGTVRGFSTILWREGDLGYALVSDVDPSELTLLGALVAGGQ